MESARRNGQIPHDLGQFRVLRGPWSTSEEPSTHSGHGTRAGLTVQVFPCSRKGAGEKLSVIAEVILTQVPPDVNPRFCGICIFLWITGNVFRIVQIVQGWAGNSVSGDAGITRKERKRRARQRDPGPFFVTVARRSSFMPAGWRGGRFRPATAGRLPATPETSRDSHRPEP